MTIRLLSHDQDILQPLLRRSASIARLTSPGETSTRGYIALDFLNRLPFSEAASPARMTSVEDCFPRIVGTRLELSLASRNSS